MDNADELVFCKYIPIDAAYAFPLHLNAFPPGVQGDNDDTLHTFFAGQLLFYILSSSQFSQ